MDDYIFPGISGGISYSSNPLGDLGTVTSSPTYTPSGFSLGDLGSGIKDLFSSAVGLYNGYNQTQIQLAQSNAATQIAKTQAASATANAQAQAAWQQRLAQYGIFSGNTGADSFNSANISASLGNMQRTLAGGGDPSQRMMMWLTVAGLALAWMQYAKK